MDDPNKSVQESFSLNPDFKHLAFIIGVLLILGAWKFGLEGLIE